MRGIKHQLEFVPLRDGFQGRNIRWIAKIVGGDDRTGVGGNRRFRCNRVKGECLSIHIGKNWPQASPPHGAHGSHKGKTGHHYIASQSQAPIHQHETCCATRHPEGMTYLEMLCSCFFQMPQVLTCGQHTACQNAAYSLRKRIVKVGEFGPDNRYFCLENRCPPQNRWFIAHNSPPCVIEELTQISNSNVLGRVMDT